VIRYRGLTWDHPRGFNALHAAAARLAERPDGIAIQWDRQPLEGFESHPLYDLCGRYDLVVLDHPHVGEAVAAGCLVPLEDLFAPDDILTWSRETIGACLASYRYAGRHWALPLDAATQVQACRPDLLDEPLDNWSDLLAVSETVPVALSIVGPHALLTFFSLATAFGEAPAEADPDTLVSERTGEQALAIMRVLLERMPSAIRALNPIGLLDRMALTDDVALCPLVYGYVNYAAPALAGQRPIAFRDAPRAVAGGRPGSTLGGTGIGVTRRCHVTPGLLAHLRWLLGEEAQIAFIPNHDGQPSRRQAWHDRVVNARWGGFYERTAETIERAYVRPRHAGYIRFQTEGAEILRCGLAAGKPVRTVLEALQACYTRSRPAGAER
jgi:multiple sugar transport system substrate-binding protein